jgi:hypothetical protein
VPSRAEPGGQGRRAEAQAQHQPDCDRGEDGEADPDVQRGERRVGRVKRRAAPGGPDAVRHALAEDELEEHHHDDQPMQRDLTGRIASGDRLLHHASLAQSCLE